MKKDINPKKENQKKKKKRKKSYDFAPDYRDRESLSSYRNDGSYHRYPR